MCEPDSYKWLSYASIANPLRVDLTTNLNAEAVAADFMLSGTNITIPAGPIPIEDFGLSGTTITIPAGPIPNGGPDCVTVTAANCVTVTIIDDDILERSEGFDSR
jgi:hypothetical protein